MDEGSQISLTMDSYTIDAGNVNLLGTMTVGAGDAVTKLTIPAGTSVTIETTGTLEIGEPAAIKLDGTIINKGTTIDLVNGGGTLWSGKGTGVLVLYGTSLSYIKINDVKTLVVGRPDSKKGQAPVLVGMMSNNTKIYVKSDSYELAAGTAKAFGVINVGSSYPVKSVTVRDENYDEDEDTYWEEGHAIIVHEGGTFTYHVDSEAELNHALSLNATNAILTKTFYSTVNTAGTPIVIGAGTQDREKPVTITGFGKDDKSHKINVGIVIANDNITLENVWVEINDRAKAPVNANWNNYSTAILAVRTDTEGKQVSIDENGKGGGWVNNVSILNNQITVTGLTSNFMGINFPTGYGNNNAGYVPQNIVISGNIINLAASEKGAYAGIEIDLLGTKEYKITGNTVNVTFAEQDAKFWKGEGSLADWGEMENSTITGIHINKLVNESSWDGNFTTDISGNTFTGVNYDWYIYKSASANGIMPVSMAAKNFGTDMSTWILSDGAADDFAYYVVKMLNQNLKDGDGYGRIGETSSHIPEYYNIVDGKIVGVSYWNATGAAGIVVDNGAWTKYLVAPQMMKGNYFANGDPSWNAIKEWPRQTATPTVGNASQRLDTETQSSISWKLTNSTAYDAGSTVTVTGLDGEPVAGIAGHIIDSVLTITTSGTFPAVDAGTVYNVQVTEPTHKASGAVMGVSEALALTVLPGLNDGTVTTEVLDVGKLAFVDSDNVLGMNIEGDAITAQLNTANFGENANVTVTWKASNGSISKEFNGSGSTLTLKVADFIDGVYTLDADTTVDGITYGQKATFTVMK
jgi:hypothetical protein